MRKAKHRARRECCDAHSRMGGAERGIPAIQLRTYKATRKHQAYNTTCNPTPHMQSNTRVSIPQYRPQSNSEHAKQRASANPTIPPASATHKCKPKQTLCAHASILPARHTEHSAIPPARLVQRTAPAPLIAARARHVCLSYDSDYGTASHRDSSSALTGAKPSAMAVTRMRPG